MGYKNKDKQREYQRMWKATRRESFIGGKPCIECGSYSNLELHHINPNEKESHSIWSWSKIRIEAEMAKCEIRCRKCHKSIHKELESHSKGEAHFSAKLKRKDVVNIRLMIMQGRPQHEIVKMYDVSKCIVSKIKRNKTWKHVMV